MPRYERLTRDQRYTIDGLIRKGATQKAIATAIGVAPSTVSRELRRLGAGQSHCCQAAHRQAKARRARPRRRLSQSLWGAVEEKLRREQWSPQQISATFKAKGMGSVSHESIYRHVYADKRAGGELHRHLLHRAKSYRKRGLGRERRGRIRNQVMIDQRPAIVEERSRLGDWEMDTLIGRPGGRVLVTLVERRSRYTLIGLASSKEAKAVGAVLARRLKPHRDKVLTMTI